MNAVLNSLHDLFSLDTVFLELLMFALYFEFTFWFVFQKNCRDFVIIFSLVSTSSVSFGSLTALYLIYLLLFNFQGPSLAARLSFSLARLEYYIIFFAVCQGVLQKFFWFFSTFLLLSLDATFILYHILSRLSRGFWKVFRSFFRFALFNVLSLTALILYHIPSILSSLF